MKTPNQSTIVHALLEVCRLHHNVQVLYRYKYLPGKA